MEFDFQDTIVVGVVPALPEDLFSVSSKVEQHKAATEPCRNAIFVRFPGLKDL